MTSFKELVNRALCRVHELFPWDAQAFLERYPDTLVLDIREPHEFSRARISHSLNIPRGVLEAACDRGYEETEPILVNARQRPILVVCRSGNRSVLAADTMQQMGFQNVHSLKTGLKGWNDFDLPLLDTHGKTVEGDDAEKYFSPKFRADRN